MPVSKIDRLRWRIAVAMAPKVRHPIAPPNAADTFRTLLEGLGHRVVKARGGDPETRGIVAPIFGSMASPFDAKIVTTSTRTRTLIREIVRMIDPDARVTIIADARSRSLFLFDPTVLPKLQPRRNDEPALTVPADRISPRSGRDVCHYCKTAPGLTMDHVVPFSFGGSDAWWNIVSACKSCNSKKGNLAPICPCDFCRRSVALFIDGYRRA